MSNERIEYRRYSREDIEQVLKMSAKLALIGRIYIGDLGEQEVRWCDDGTVEIFTHHTPKRNV